ncbi:hypothetical protein B0H63DRAFT_538547 [Podospora didyma]|uniref:BHLH domain-containing protein n=1 Tax=Podospora didyma TaxID=330526 RepID=A0AAE0NYX5_9PEZI|nr:hypothetical protein B0H63DRAFT_538547 [Podospora didyma]
MHPDVVSSLAYSFATKCEESFPESFPERYLDSPARSPGPDRSAPQSHAGDGILYTQPHPVLPRPETFQVEPGLSSFWSQSWLEQSQHVPFHRHSHHGPRAASPPALVNYGIFTSPIPPPSPAQTDWDMLQTTFDQSSSISAAVERFQWAATQCSELKIEDDSDSILSLNDSLEEFCPPQSAWPPPATQRFRRRSVPKITKPSRLMPPTAAAAALSRPNRRSTYNNNTTHHQHQHQPHHDSSPDNLFDLSEVLLPPSDYPLPQPTSAATPATDHPTTPTFFAHPGGGGPDDEFSSTTKALSKRIAHKLSEKSRRNRLTVAIREIQRLLPPGAPPDRTITENPNALTPSSPLQADESQRGFVSTASTTTTVGGSAPISKVDVVEMAIGYIKRLQKENEKSARRAEEAESELREARRQKEVPTSPIHEASVAVEEDKPSENNEDDGARMAVRKTSE